MRTLADIATLEVGFAFPSAAFGAEGSGPRLVRGDNIGHGALRWSPAGTWAWPGEVPHERYELSAGDLVLAMDRPWIASGIKFASVSEADLPALLVQRVVRLRCQSGVPQGFLRYLISDPAYADYIQAVQTGTSIPHVSARQIGAYPVPRIGNAQASAIAEVLGALDDKIAANQAVALGADKLAQAEFLSVSRHSTSECLLADLVSTQYGITTRPMPGGSHKLARVTDINKQPWIEWDGAPTCDLTCPEIEKYALRHGDIVVARMADPGKAGFVDGGGPDSAFASYLVRVRPIRHLEPLFLYYFLRSPAYIEYSLSSMQGSVQSNMNARVIVGAQIPIVDSTQQESFARAASVLRRRMAAATVESRHLATLRDTLLPHLMSGRLTVRDAEARVEAAL